MFTLDSQVQRELFRAKQTLITGYVPFARRGNGKFVCKPTMKKVTQ